MKDGSSKKYNMTMQGAMKWAQHEIKSVGYLIGVKDKDIQYAWAQSIVNGMLHLRDALLELVNDPEYSHNKEELLRMHDKVIRIVKHVIKDFNVNLEEIKQFNTRQVLGPLNYLKDTNSNSKSRKNRKNNKNKNVKKNKTRKANILNNDENNM
jgi:hypothetical protein